jgi:hypothetical protein
MLRFSIALRFAVDNPAVLDEALRASSPGFLGMLDYTKKNNQVSRVTPPRSKQVLRTCLKIFSISMLLYRGNSSGNATLENIPTYFATSQNNAKAYGTVRSYELKQSLNLLNMGSVNEVTRLMLLAPPAIHNDIVKTFNISNGHQVKRNSNVGPDRRVAHFICSLGYDGYRAPRLLRKNGGHFHAEVVLCKPRSVLKNTKPVIVNLIPPRAPTKKRRPTSNNN